jgi:hypothetical protein
MRQDIAFVMLGVFLTGTLVASTFAPGTLQSLDQAADHAGHDQASSDNGGTADGGHGHDGAETTADDESATDHGATDHGAGDHGAGDDEIASAAGHGHGGESPGAGASEGAHGNTAQPAGHGSMGHGTQSGGGGHGGAGHGDGAGHAGGGSDGHSGGSQGHGDGHEDGGQAHGDGHGGGDHGDDGHEDGMDGHGDEHGDGDGGHGDHGGGGDGHGDDHGDGDDGHGDEHGDGHGNEDDEDFMVAAAPQNRMEAWSSRDAGELHTIRLQYGPYLVAAGQDLNRIDFDIVGADGFLVGARPTARFADGSEVAHELMHIHHAHLFRARPDQHLEWVFGTGGETTEASWEIVSDADPRDRRYGVPLQQGEPLYVISMMHNMSERDLVVWLEFELDYKYGTTEEIAENTGEEYGPVVPVIHGTTFNVPNTGDIYAWPRDMEPGDGSDATGDSFHHDSFRSDMHADNANVVPGVGHIWTAPEDGEIIGTAGHTHKGALWVNVASIGSEDEPCADDGDGFAGTTIARSEAFYPPGVFPGHLAMGVTQPGWRAYVRKGDRIAINGVFDATTYAYPDQMSIIGFYYDPDVEVTEEQRCSARLVDEPEASQEQIITSLPHQLASRDQEEHEAHAGHGGGHECVADECNDYSAPPPAKGAPVNTVTITDFEYIPGTQKGTKGHGLFGPSGDAAPVVKRGDSLRFFNTDYPRGGVRHAVTSCYGPCNGPKTMSYPLSDGLFDSGPIGYSPLAETASISNQATPTYELDTSDLEPGYYAYYCRAHPHMRGGFWVED